MNLRGSYNATNFLISCKSMLASKQGLGFNDLFVCLAFLYMVFGWIISWLVS